MGGFTRTTQYTHDGPDPSSFYNRAMIYYRQGFNSNGTRELNLGISRIPTYSEYYFARSLLQDSPSDEIRDLLICKT